MSKPVKQIKSADVINIRSKHGLETCAVLMISGRLFHNWGPLWLNAVSPWVLVLTFAVIKRPVPGDLRICEGWYHKSRSDK